MQKKFWWRLGFGAAVLSFSALLASYFGRTAGKTLANFLQNAGWIGMILSVSYLGTMFYVRYLYQEAIERWEEHAK